MSIDNEQKWGILAVDRIELLLPSAYVSTDTKDASESVASCWFPLKPQPPRQVDGLHWLRMFACTFEVGKRDPNMRDGERI